MNICFVGVLSVFCVCYIKYFGNVSMSLFILKKNVLNGLYLLKIL